jgi:DNA-binding Lrp family transcriptional regulator
MVDEDAPRWKFLTNHAQVLVCVAHDPGVRLREISDRVGITERAAHRIVDELAAGGYITRERVGRRNRYTIENGAQLPDRLGRIERVGDLLSVLANSDAGALDTAVSQPDEAATRSPARRRRR